MYDFGEFLKKLRTDSGFTQSQLARKINKSRSLISKYESNQKIPTLETLIDLSILFHISLDTLAGIEKEESIIIGDLSPSQIDLINHLLHEFRKEKKYISKGLNCIHFEIINKVIEEFLKT